MTEASKGEDRGRGLLIDCVVTGGGNGREE